MTTIREVCEYLDRLAPPDLAESWDNTGLLLGDSGQPIERLMTCLTITAESAAEAIADEANLVVVHHPLPFRPLGRITTDSTTGRLLWQLARAGIALYSAHTRFDSTESGINQQWGQRLKLNNLRPLTPQPDDATVGSGRIGELPGGTSLEGFANSLKLQFGLGSIAVAGRLDAPVRAVAIACGSGGSLLEAACQAGCDTFLTGEANFHTALECRARGVGLVLLGHYASERFAMESLAGRIAQDFPQLHCWPARSESDPITHL